MNFQAMERQRKFILIAAAIGIISTFMPWVTISAFGFSQSTNGFHGWGILAFLAFFVAAIVALTGNQTQHFDKNSRFLVMACAGVALISIIIKTAFSDNAGEGIAFVDAGIGIGVWIAIASAAGIALCAWLFKSTADHLKNNFEGSKKSISVPATSVPKPDTAVENTGFSKTTSM